MVYGIAIAGGLGTYLLLGQLVGGGMGMPRFEAAVVGNLELTWLIPLSLIGTICGWLYFVSEHASEAHNPAPESSPGSTPRHSKSAKPEKTSRMAAMESRVFSVE